MGEHEPHEEFDWKAAEADFHTNPEQTGRLPLQEQLERVEKFDWQAANEDVKQKPIAEKYQEELVDIFDWKGLENEVKEQAEANKHDLLEPAECSRLGQQMFGQLDRIMKENPRATEIPESNRKLGGRSLTLNRVEHGEIMDHYNLQDYDRIIVEMGVDAATDPFVLVEGQTDDYVDKIELNEQKMPIFSHLDYKTGDERMNYVLDKKQALFAADLLAALELATERARQNHHKSR